MNTLLLFLCSGLILVPASTGAQLLAGEVPDGMSALEVDLNLTLTAPFTADSVAVEFDCDDFHDAWAVLYRGAPEVDAPNTALLRLVDDDIEVCATPGTILQQRPKYHAFGEVLDCAGDFDWQPVNDIVLGDFGGFTAIGPITIADQYIAYRRGAQTGWIQLSFDLQGGSGNVSLDVHQLLPLCPSIMSVGESGGAAGITLYPNPTDGDPIRVESRFPLRSMDVLDATGRIVAQYSGTLALIPAPTIAGTYVVRAVHTDGRVSFAQLVMD